MQSCKSLLPVLFLLLSGCATAAGPAAGAAEPPETRAVDLRNLPRLGAIMPQLAENRVVFVGETHDVYADHLNQLAIIRGLHARNPDLAIGLEFFQEPFQQHLDAFVAGEISEAEMLRRTEYFERWKYDYRLYRPILDYARENRLKLLALNVPAELTGKVGRGGLESLEPEDKARLPEIEPADDQYRERLEWIFRQHPNSDEKAFDNFVEAQLLWDEAMAQRVADYLDEHPDSQMVVLAGSGHVAYGVGIPSRVTRRTGAESAIVLNGLQESPTPDIADFVLLTDTVELPPKGRLGILMETAEDGVIVRNFTEDSAAETAGVKTGDRIVRLASREIGDTTDVQLAMLDAQVGDDVELTVRRGNWIGEDKVHKFTITLQ